MFQAYDVLVGKVKFGGLHNITHGRLYDACSECHGDLVWKAKTFTADGRLQLSLIIMLQAYDVLVGKVKFDGLHKSKGYASSECHGVLAGKAGNLIAEGISRTRSLQAAYDVLVEKVKLAVGGLQ